MSTTGYAERRVQLTKYFDRTAAEAWRLLTSDAPVNRIRQTVREGRERMRAELLDRLPADLHGMRLLDAGCGTGALAIEAARRGADVVAVDVAGNLIDIARSRSAETTTRGGIRFEVGDMCAPELGAFDHVVLMDSLIHYDSDDIVRSVSELAARCRQSLLFTYAPKTPALAAMHFVGRLVPHSSRRAPAIVPVTQDRLLRRLGSALSGSAWRVADGGLVSSGFYKSSFLELQRR